MDKFVVTGIPAFNGEYPLNDNAFTMRELEIIKRMSGVRSGELAEAFAARDAALILAVAVIAVKRSGKNWQAFEQLAWDSPLGDITFVGEDEEAAEEPIPLTQTQPAPTANENVQTPPSGEHSLTGGDESQAMSLQVIGSQV